MSDGILAAALDDIEPGDALLLSTDLTRTEEPISLFRDDDGAWFALDDTCSHADASLADGWIEDGEVECPLHASRFCLRTGVPQCLPATEPVTAHRVEVRDDGVYLFPGEPPQG